jgi:nucleotide-binding universal stress UspA family protein
MIVDSILVPTDFSATSEAALHYAAQMALTFGARLYLLHVPGKTGEHFEASFPIGQFDTAAGERLLSFLTKEELERLRPEYVMRVGPPADEIVLYAGMCDADLIIMGTHGRSGLAHALMGSVAEQVVRVAPCPVLLVRAPRAAVAEGAGAVVPPVEKTLGPSSGVMI